jgi:hypothetical protein
MWVSAPIKTAWGSVNQRMTVASITSVVCQNTYNVTLNTLASVGIPSSAIINSNLANGCAVVTPLPSATTPTRIAYKLFFSVTADQWKSITTAFYTSSGSRNMVQYGHTMCGSTVSFQTLAGVSTGADISFVTQPTVSANTKMCD